MLYIYTENLLDYTNTGVSVSDMITPDTNTMTRAVLSVSSKQPSKRGSSQYSVSLSRLQIIHVANYGKCGLMKRYLIDACQLVINFKMLNCRRLS